MWEHGKCLKCVQQDAILRCGNLDYHIGGCVMCGHGKEALKHFEWMYEEDVKLDDISFVCLFFHLVAMHVFLCFSGHKLYDLY